MKYFTFVLGVAFSIAASGSAADHPLELEFAGEARPTYQNINQDELSSYLHKKITHITFHHEGFGSAESALLGRLGKPNDRWVTDLNDDHASRGLGWGMIAYNYAIHRNGTVFKGRPVKYAPATGSKYAGTQQIVDFSGHFAVVALADYEHEPLANSPKIVPLMIEVMSAAQLKYKVPTRNIASHDGHLGHHDATDCPGKHLKPIEKEIIERTFATSMQTLLTQRGCEPKGIDGYIGNNTKKAFAKLALRSRSLGRLSIASDDALFLILNDTSLTCR